MKAQETGYYDHTGRAIRDGDSLKAIFADGTILRGFVDIDDVGAWVLHGKSWWAPLSALDDVEILEGNNET